MLRLLVPGVVALLVASCQVGTPPAGGGEDAVEMAPATGISFGKSCDECDFNIKNGLNCSKPAKKRCGEGDLTHGGGWCVARATDSKGYCSSSCKAADDCPSGYSCQDLKTGATFCAR